MQHHHGIDHPAATSHGPSTSKLTGDSPACIQLYSACTGCTNKAYAHELELPSPSTTRVSQVGRALQLKQFLAVAEPVHSKQSGQGRNKNFCPTRQAVAIHPDIVLFSQSQPNSPKPTPTTLFNLQDRSFLVGNGSPRNREHCSTTVYVLNNENKHGLTACRARPQAAEASGKAAARDAALPFFSCPPNF